MKVLSGWESLIVVGGVECMSRVPMGSDGGSMSSDPRVSFKTPFIPQGIGARLNSNYRKFSRKDVDQLLSRAKLKQLGQNREKESLSQLFLFVIKMGS